MHESLNLPGSITYHRTPPTWIRWAIPAAGVVSFIMLVIILTVSPDIDLPTSVVVGILILFAALQAWNLTIMYRLFGTTLHQVTLHEEGFEIVYFSDWREHTLTSEHGGRYEIRLGMPERFAFSKSTMAKWELREQQGRRSRVAQQIFLVGWTAYELRELTEQFEAFYHEHWHEWFEIEFSKNRRGLEGGPGRI